jgi:hypothetical protein
VIWTGLVWLRIGTNGGSSECGNEPSGFVTGKLSNGYTTGGLSSSAQLHRVS